MNVLVLVNNFESRCCEIYIYIYINSLDHRYDGAIIMQSQSFFLKKCIIMRILNMMLSTFLVTWPQIKRTLQTILISHSTIKSEETCVICQYSLIKVNSWNHMNYCFSIKLCQWDEKPNKTYVMSACLVSLIKLLFIIYC